MNHGDMEVLIKGIAPVLRDTIARAMQPVVLRLIALEARERLQGDPGDVGQDGKDGQDGQDGKNADPALVAKLVEEMVATIPLPTDGEPGRDAYAGQARGLFDSNATYRAMDVVTFNASEWRAKRDDPGELPGEGWMLSASRGKRGDRGDRGLNGANGKDGANPIALSFDGDEMKFIMVLDNGEQLEADFYPVAKAIRGE